MKAIRVKDGIVPLGEFKANAARLLKELREDTGPLVITHNGRPVAVMLAPEA
ncbi:MAG: type II toxin-antitoxin system Phd/YefM family antitoxin [Candidatus Riflebacteria bacterium]|nr:type II toxin-antitoxin system Phd/YefM family antitoxin [Candidatus Riflebacteria bacterium]